MEITQIAVPEITASFIPYGAGNEGVKKVVSKDLEMSLVTRQDIETIAAFHAYARMITDGPFLPEYIKASVVCGYFHKKWKGWFDFPSENNLAVKATEGGRIVAFVACGSIDPPEDIADGCRNFWGELHHLYLAPEQQGRGLGRVLFGIAANHLAGRGCDRMLINVLEGNHLARKFYEKMGARYMNSIVEQNERGGTVFAVPCALYGKFLKPEPQ